MMIRNNDKKIDWLLLNQEKKPQDIEQYGNFSIKAKEKKQLTFSSSFHFIPNEQCEYSVE